MEAGPRDVPPPERGRARAADLPGRVAVDGLDLDGRDPAGRAPDGQDLDGRHLDRQELDDTAGDDADTGDGASDSGAEAQSFRELRPERRLRIWQLAPIVALGTLGSLMFAFPLAFEFGGGGAVVAMLGLLLCYCSAGWGIMAARRVGHTWPGLPARDSGGRPDWRFIVLYVVITGVLAVLAVWRVARLR
jgi:hypothetical protein